MSIPEFDGTNADLWIQNLEQCIESGRPPLDQGTEIAMTDLKGSAVQWWRGIVIIAATLSWHRFTRYVGDRVSKHLFCDNVRKFHALTQTSTVAKYTKQFEEAVNLMHRDNPTLRDI